MFEDELAREYEEAVDAMPTERQQLAFQRACRKVGFETWWEGKKLCTDGDPYDERLVDAFGAELERMVFEDQLFYLRDEGYLTISTNDEGQLTYTLTEKGEAEAEALAEDLDL